VVLVVVRRLENDPEGGDALESRRQLLHVLLDVSTNGLGRREVTERNLERHGDLD
jgi:hypothetical protein